MRYWDIVRSRLRSVFFRGRRESDLRDELQFHLEREAERLRAGGMSADAARLQALRTFGGVDQVKDACRDARGVGFVDDAVRDVLYALRGFRRAPLVAVTIAGTMAIGLGLVAVAFTLLNTFLFRVDGVPDVHEMFAVERPRRAGAEPQRFTRAQFDALRRETTIFAGVFARVSDVDGRVDGRPIFGTFVTDSFFQVLGVQAALGRTLTPADDRPPAGPPPLVLSHRGWERLFAGDPAIVGRRVDVNEVTFEIVGVMPERFRGLAAWAPDDYWSPLSALGHVRPLPPGRDATAGLEIVGRLKPGVSRQAAVAQLAAWDARQPTEAPRERGAPALTLAPRRGTVEQPLEAVLVTAPLFFAFGLILLIGCANVANLLLSRALARQREIGIRLSLGASRRRIVRQLLTESLLLSLAAAAAGFAVSRAVLHAIVSAMTTSLPPGIGDIRLLVPDADWRVLLFLVAGAGVSTLVFALAPALQATRTGPLRTIRGEMVGHARPGRARHVLIGLQVAASALLLICAAVFLKSAVAASSDDPGLRIADTVMVPIAHESARVAIVEAVMAEPSVAAVAASSTRRTALAESADEKAPVAYQFVSPEYFSVLDIAVVRGRAFTPAERGPGLPLAIVSETTARTLWPDAEAVGQRVRLDPETMSDARRTDPPSLELRSFTVVGIARDVPGFRIAPFPKSIVYLPTTAAAPGTALVVRVHGNPALAGQRLSDRLRRADPGAGQVETMAWVARMETYFLQLASGFTAVLGGLALVLTVSGLFGVLSYLVEQRAREIGVRVALGATPLDVTRLVLGQSIRPVGLGLLAGAGSVATLARVLVAASDTPIGPLVFAFDPLAYAMSVSIIVAACLAAAAIPARGAARLDPTVTLRRE
jgi:predicted permease